MVDEGYSRMGDGKGRLFDSQGFCHSGKVCARLAGNPLLSRQEEHWRSFRLRLKAWGIECLVTWKQTLRFMSPNSQLCGISGSYLSSFPT